MLCSYGFNDIRQNYDSETQGAVQCTARALTSPRPGIGLAACDGEEETEINYEETQKVSLSQPRSLSIACVNCSEFFHERGRGEVRDACVAFIPSSPPSSGD